MRPSRLVAVGASWGGLEAVARLLAQLPRDLAACVVIAQHRTRDDEDGLLEVLARTSALPLREPDDKEPLVAGQAFLAPADYHLLIEGDRIALSVDPPVNFARPSIDLLFESAAFAFGADAVGVLLTGLGRDGAAGLHAIRSAGGITAIEDPETAASPALPRSALELLTPNALLPLGELARYIAAKVGVGTAEPVRSGPAKVS